MIRFRVLKVKQLLPVVWLGGALLLILWLLVAVFQYQRPFTAAMGNASLVGKWKGPNGTIYDFRGDGTVRNDGESFKYRYADNQLFITYSIVFRERHWCSTKSKIRNLPLPLRSCDPSHIALSQKFLF